MKYDMCNKCQPTFQRSISEKQQQHQNPTTE